MTVKVKENMYPIRNWWQRYWHVILFGVIWLYASSIHFLWLLFNRDLPWGNGLHAILRALELFYLYKEVGFSAFLNGLIGFGYCYPPLCDFGYFLYYAVFGVHTYMEFMVHQLFFLLGMLGVFGIGKHYFGKGMAITALVAFISFPGVLEYSKSGCTEFQMTCLLVLSVFLLIKGNLFQSRFYSVLFGFCCGLLLLVRWYSMLYVVQLLVLFGLWNYKQWRILFRRTVLINMAFTVMLFSAVGLPWYIKNWHSVVSHCVQGRFSSHADVVDLICLSGHAYTYYVQCMFEALLSRVHGLYVMMAVAISLFVYRKRKEARILLLISLHVFGYLLVFGFIEPKDNSHGIFLLPFMSLMIAGGVFLITMRRIRYILISLLIVLACMLTVVHLLGDYVLDMHAFGAPANYLIGEHALDKTYMLGQYDWRNTHQELLRIVSADFEQHADSREHKPSLLFLINNHPMRCFQSEYINFTMGKPVNIYGRQWTWEEQDPRVHLFGARFDYVVMEKPSSELAVQGHENVLINEMLSLAESEKETFDRMYRLLWKIDTPRNSQILLYKRVGNEAT